MVLKALAAFACLVKCQRDEEIILEDPLADYPSAADPNFYIDQLKAIKEKKNRTKTRKDRVIPTRAPVIFDNDHTFGNWTSANSTSDDSCSYVRQSDGSILINTMHQYKDFDYCHEYWECKNPDHKMFFKWNRVQIEESSECLYDWARLAWGTADNEQEYLCTPDDNLTHKQKHYRNTGGNKIVWDFGSDDGIVRWGVEAQILCRDPNEVNECIDGSHDCSDNVECVKEIGKSGYTCECSSDGLKWGDRRLLPTGSGTNSDPCKYNHPDISSMEIFPIKWHGETHGISFETFQKLNWKSAFKRCNELGMTLPLPSNDEENTALTNALINRNLPWWFNRIFLGAHNANNERKWVNVYTNEEMKYNQWSVIGSQPDNTGNVEKVVEMWSTNGDWNDMSLTYENHRALICIKVDYEDWEPANQDLGEFFCETGLHLCHPTSTCVDYDGGVSEDSTSEDYKCTCSDVTVDGVVLKPTHYTVFTGYNCRYILPGLPSNHYVNVFNYDGKPPNS